MGDGARKIWQDRPVWLLEGGDKDWQTHQIWVHGDDGRRVTIDPVSEVVVPGISAASRRIDAGSGAVNLSMVLARGASAAGLFTRSACASPSAIRGREVVADGRVDVVAIVSKNANVATPTAVADTDAVVRAIGRAASVDPDNVLLSCTGVIGEPLPVDEVTAAVPEVRGALDGNGLATVSSGILTTDPRPKMVAAKVGEITVAGMVKGAGMIEPRMATMLAYLFTDAAVSPPMLRSCLSEAVGRSLNVMTVDSDTSTSDTTAFIASGARELPEGDEELFRHSVLAVCTALARAVVSDAEGATKIVEVDVAGASSGRICEAVARQIANSPLVKAAVNGNDPNWGRVVMALGKPDAYEGSSGFDMSALRIRLSGVTTYDGGREVAHDPDRLRQTMQDSPSVQIEVDLGAGPHRIKVWGCDLSEEYVRFNSVYTT
jgi:glutamate N-acetyltransferase/amino-acid N-acetyltransferase